MSGCVTCITNYNTDPFGRIIPLSGDPLERAYADGWVRVDNNYMVRQCVPGSACVQDSRLLSQLLNEYARQGYSDPLARAAADGWVIQQNINGEFYATRPCPAGMRCFEERRPISDIVRQYNPSRMPVLDLPPSPVDEGQIMSALSGITSAAAAAVVALSPGSVIQKAFSLGFYIPGAILNLDISSVVSIVSNEFNNLQRKLFGNIEMTADGFFKFTFDQFIAPVDNALKNLATMPAAVLLAPGQYVYGTITTGVMRVKEIVDQSLFNLNYNLIDIMPGFFGKCPLLDEVLGQISLIPEHVKQFVSSVIGNITGPLNTLLTSVQYYVDAVYQQFLESVQSMTEPIKDFIANMSQIIGIIPYALNQIKNAIVEKFKEYVSDAIDGIRSAIENTIAEVTGKTKEFFKDLFGGGSYFLSKFKDLAEKLKDIADKVRPIFETIASILECAAAFGFGGMSSLISNQSKLESQFRDLTSNPLAQLATSVNSYINARVNMINTALDESVKVADYESRVKQQREYQETRTTDILSYVMGNYSELYTRSRTRDTQFTGEYISLKDGTVYRLTFCEEMLWEISSRIYDVLKGTPTDDNLLRIYDTLSKTDFGVLYDEIRKSVSETNKIDFMNRLLFEIIRRAAGVETNYAMINVNILDALTFMSTYLLHFSDDFISNLYRYNYIIKSGRAMGSFVSANYSVNLVFIETNDITDMDKKEMTRLRALSYLLNDDELNDAMEYFRVISGEFDPADFKPLPPIDINSVPPIEPELIDEDDPNIRIQGDDYAELFNH